MADIGKRPDGDEIAVNGRVEGLLYPYGRLARFRGAAAALRRRNGGYSNPVGAEEEQDCNESTLLKFHVLL